MHHKRIGLMVAFRLKVRWKLNWKVKTNCKSCNIWHTVTWHLFRILTNSTFGSFGFLSILNDHIENHRYHLLFWQCTFQNQAFCHIECQPKVWAPTKSRHKLKLICFKAYIWRKQIIVRQMNNHVCWELFIGCRIQDQKIAIIQFNCHDFFKCLLANCNETLKTCNWINFWIELCVKFQVKIRSARPSIWNQLIKPSSVTPSLIKFTKFVNCRANETSPA